jgi:hypothetical protein
MTTKKETKNGYRIQETSSGWAVIRKNGDLAEFLGEMEATSVAKLLAAGKASQRSYDWQKMA